MPGHVDRRISKERVKIITHAADANRAEFMARQIGKTVQVLVEEKNIARDPHDIDVKIAGAPVAERTVCDVVLSGIDGDAFIGTLQ